VRQQMPKAPLVLACHDPSPKSMAGPPTG
jgi:hypothetical protein